VPHTVQRWSQVSTLNEPCAHARQASARRSEPGWHVHSLTLVLPLRGVALALLTGEYALQSRHSSAPGACEKDPGSHGWHWLLETPSLKVPRAHGRQGWLGPTASGSG